MSDAIEFTLNGRAVRVAAASTHLSLLDWLRSNRLTGTKEGCAEGDCGACTVAIVDTDAQGRRTWRSVTACITLLPMVAGREVLTVEGIAEGAPHPVQRAMAEHYGSQCGYCTPGFVMSMFEAYYRPDDLDRPALADQLCGNLCRCTGYRPIRDAALDVLATRSHRPDDRFRLPLAAPTAPARSLEHVDPETGDRFLRPTTLDALCALRRAYPEAALVAGATEVGVEINKKFRRFPLLITTEHVAGLADITRVDGRWEVGGAATLTALEEALGASLPGVTKMLRVFASRQIRNRATLAGNLVTASPIGDMPPTLMALDAEVVTRSVEGQRVIPLSEFFTGYRKTALRGDEVVEKVRFDEGPSDPAWTRRFNTYKVSKRRELDISIVAAAFCVDVDASNVVRRARLAFGGVAATPVRALEAERYLEGSPWTRERMAGALPLLRAAFTPIADARSEVPFRRELVASLFEKFFDGVETLGQDLPLEFTPGAEYATADASRALKHESGLGHATGAAVYVEDQALDRPMLELWPVCSPHARARIVRRDATKARAMPGVAAVYFADDIPGTNDVGAIRPDEPLLAKDEVLFHGQMVAVVVGESYDACHAAALCVEVEYEALPAVIGIDAAIAADSWHTSGHRIRRGEPEAAIAAAPRALEGVVTMGGQEHFYLESHAAWAERTDDGGVRIVSSTQHPSEIQAVVSHVLHLPRASVTVESPRMGGGFGGKETQGNAFAALCALTAWKTGRPTRVMLDRDLDMALTGKRHPFRADFRVGFDLDGRVLGLTATLVSDGGWALDLSESINDRALFHVDNAYYLPAVDVFGRVAKTHVVSHTAFRGFGAPQGMLVIEDVIDRVARALDLPPDLVRERNFYRGDGETSTTHYGELVEDNRTDRIWSALKESSGYAARRAAVDAWNDQHPMVKRGLAITPVKFGVSFTATFLNQAGALVLVYRDGSVQVNHGGTEMGQGLYTKLQGVAMRELGVPAERVRMMKTQTDKVPNTSATAASSGADLNGAAVRAACVTLRERLVGVAAGMLSCEAAEVAYEGGRFAARGASVTWEAACERAYLTQVPLSATGFYKTPNIGYDRTVGRGRPFHYYAFGAAVTEVELDGYSGMKRIVRTDILHDVGDSLNPSIDRGQVEGAYVQGVGWLTGEELKWDAKGRLLTHSASTYQIPSVSDAPMDFRVALLPDAAQRSVIHGSKAVGEPPFMLALSAREALRDAVAAFGPRGGVVTLPSPATHEALFHAVRARLRATGELRDAAE
jgi:xanthine dehydrogenase molybdopterin binding subunit/xanthine dehydrogenase small subunit